MMMTSVIAELAGLRQQAWLSLPPSGSPSSFSRFLSLGQADRAVVREAEGWRWSRVSHLKQTVNHLVRDFSLYLSNISAMVSPLNSRGLTQKFSENTEFAWREKIGRK